LLLRTTKTLKEGDLTLKYLILLTSLIFIGACSEGDRGLRYSDAFVEQAKIEKASTPASTCAFPDINHTPTTDEYSSATEGLITDLFGKYVSALEPVDSFDLSGQVNYTDWLASNQDKGTLCTIVNHMKNTDAAALTGDDKKVFYINAYNIFTIELILKQLSEVDKGADRDFSKFPDQKSIRNILGLSDAVWDTFKWKVGSQSLTLNQIEKGILVPMGDARIHFAVNCASKGCPPLRNEAFTAGNIDTQLDEMSDFFVSSPAYSEIEIFDDYEPESGDNFYYISEIFKWYAVDFENDTSGRYGSVRAFLAYHLKTSDDDLGFPKQDLLNEDYWEQDYISYDWALNEIGN